MPARLLLFTKPATPGRVKTRLAATIGAERAAEIHRAFAGDVAERLRDRSDFELRISWALDEGEQPPDWPETRNLAWHRQSGPDLGERLFKALKASSDGAQPVAAVGSDHPEVTAEAVSLAFARLKEDADLVLGPALDGGYFLIALAPQAVKRRIFEDIDWSTDAVRAQTLERARELGLRVYELEPGHDIDREDDLLQLASRLGKGGGGGCPRTRKVLEAWGWIEGDRELTASKVGRA